MISQIHVFNNQRYQGLLRRTPKGFAFEPISIDSRHSDLATPETQGYFPDLPTFKQAIAPLTGSLEGWRFIGLEPTPQGFANEWFVLDEKENRIGIIRYFPATRQWSAIVKRTRHTFLRQAECIAICFQNPQTVITQAIA